ncbi:Major Facilitator Superfamily [Geosmithia morbida]|uniref:Major Facilitator Superfamily n=1 Tax=Geosmithia morbida TaxID=1094350 RepID=A0A9P4YPZ2_9HYPO|nr:Major Facilitator Superfamily [Geosmithia morbida]KAF4120600.1 Major Facilitator Superfamily [Geosmithia morbida]
MSLTIELGGYDEDVPFLSPLARHSFDVQQETDDSQDSDSSSVDDDDDDDSSSRRITGAAWWQASSPSSIVILLALVKFTCVLCGLLMMMPVYQFIEDTFCHIHYGDDSPGFMDEMACKVDEVQSSLALMTGWQGLLGGVMNLITAYPYGLLADRIGRKPTALFAYAGSAASFYLTPLAMGPSKYLVRESPYIMLFGTAFVLLGGGMHVFFSTMYAMVSDVSTDKDKASNFLYITIGSAAGGLIGPLLAGLLMEKFGPWVPVTIVLYISPVVFLIFLFIPETRTGKEMKGEPTSSKPAYDDDQPTLVVIKGHLKDGLVDMRKSLVILRDRNVLLCLVTFFFINARWTASSSTLAQYISKNFEWKLAEASILLSPLGLVEMLVLASLPFLSKRLMSSRRGCTAFDKDMLICRMSFPMLFLSALIRAVSPSVVPFLFGLFVGAFGAAQIPVARAIMSAHVNPAYTSRLYALTSMVEIAGTVVGAPVLAWCFKRGMKLQGVLTGLPWLYLSLVYLLSWVALGFVRPPPMKTLEKDGACRLDGEYGV